ncbi:MULTISPECIES: HEPN domain-containing protein [Actinosynnema]|uniref:HEPN domain-containing protein n=1 Tax=Actinosynnema TaxID=40566 RepID=UPI0020A46312|nr:HEPN domain-containing protein [Actinosynnema pretiosum]MCP2100010.1 hypothetical protein [Actinosynnema pretiosum]
MEQVQPSRPPKAELVRVLGVPFLACVLGMDEQDVHAWSQGQHEELPDAEADRTLTILGELLASTPSYEDDPEGELRAQTLAANLGIYHPVFRATAVHALRTTAAGAQQVPVFEGTSAPEVLERLTVEAHPLFLLPALPLGPIGAGVHRHPLVDRFAQTVLEDPSFAQLRRASRDPDRMDVHLWRSTLCRQDFDLPLLAVHLISAGWRAALLEHHRPDQRRHVRAVLGQYESVRAALARDGDREGVRVPVLIAFTGVRLPSDTTLELGGGRLRPADERRDRHWVPGHLARRRQDPEAGAGTAGSGDDVVLETDLPYRIKVTRDAGFDKPFVEGDTSRWPDHGRDAPAVGVLVEQVRLALLLACDFTPDRPVMAVPTWEYWHDPLDHGPTLRSRTHTGRNAEPVVLDAYTAGRWAGYVRALVEHGGHIGVAVRRTLRAASERTDPEDLLVDAVIAWENLFGADQGEVTLRVVTTMARLLRPDQQGREELRGELSGIYALRSRIVHGAHVTDTPWETRRQSHRTLELTLEVLRVLLTTRTDLLALASGGARSSKVMME